MKFFQICFVLGFAFVSSHCSDGKDASENYSKKAQGAAADGSETPAAGGGTGTGTETVETPAAGGGTALTWAEIRPITKKFCEDCHLDDGFSREEIWSGIKESAILRLQMQTMIEKPDQAEEPKGLMPPSEVTLGKTMTRAEKNKIIAWLQGVAQTDREEIGDVKDPSGNTKVSGDLKTLSEAHCVSCHSDGKYLKWWTGAKAEAIKRINNKSMPPAGRAFPDADKQKFLNVLKAL